MKKNVSLYVISYDINNIMLSLVSCSIMFVNCWDHIGICKPLNLSPLFMAQNFQRECNVFRGIQQCGLNNINQFISSSIK